MKRRTPSSQDLLRSLLALNARPLPDTPASGRPSNAAVGRLMAEGLVRQDPDRMSLTEAGRAALARIHPDHQHVLDPFLSQHLDLARREASTPEGRNVVTIDDTESPLAWLARRKGKDGRPMIDPAQFQAGERLRADFTRAQMMPRVTSSWSGMAAEGGRGGGGAGEMTDLIVAARQRVRQALDAVSAEFSGLLLDVCCFLKGLEDVERERGWPPRSGKVVLQLGLDRLARHYGLATTTRGRNRAEIRTWLSSDASFTVE